MCRPITARLDGKPLCTRLTPVLVDGIEVVPLPGMADDTPAFWIATSTRFRILPHEVDDHDAAAAADDTRQLSQKTTPIGKMKGGLETEHAIKAAGGEFEVESVADVIGQIRGI